MRRLTSLVICLVALLAAVGVAGATAAGSKGTIKKSWISTTSGGPAAAKFKVATVKRLYANFVWKKPAVAGQVLRIEWHDPSGTLRAVWNDKTIKGDKEDTRLYAWIGPGVVKGKLGGWTAVLTVGSTRIGQAKFRIVA
jgi:hypothetical protein